MNNELTKALFTVGTKMRSETTFKASVNAILVHLKQYEFDSFKGRV